MTARTLQLGQTYATRDGKGSGRVVADDLSGEANWLVVLSHNDLSVGTRIAARYTADNGNQFDEDRDLIIPERKMRTVYANLHASYLHDSVQHAVRQADGFKDGTFAHIAYPVEVPTE